MTLSNAIAIIRRQDAQVKVEVPATATRKAYSYMREASASPRTPKSSNRKMIGGAIAGAVGVGALTAGVLAMRKAKQNSDEPSQSGDTVTGSSTKGAIAQGQDPQRKKPLVTPPPSGSDRVLVTPSPSRLFKGKGFDPEVMDQRMEEARDEMTPRSLALLEDRQRNEGRGGLKSKVRNEKQIRNALEKRKTLFGDEYTEEDVQAQLTASKAERTRRNEEKNKRIASRIEEITNERSKEKGLLDKGVEAIKKITKKGVERDRKAGGAFADREIDLNKAAYSAGEKTRIAAQNLATFAKAYGETFGKKQPKSVDVKATEVKEELPEGKPMKKEPKAPKPKKAKTPKVPKLKSPTAAEKRDVQQKLNDLNK